MPGPSISGPDQAADVTVWQPIWKKRKNYSNLEFIHIAELVNPFNSKAGVMDQDQKLNTCTVKVDLNFVTL